MEEFRPINQCFEKSDTIRAQHLLWDDFRKERTDVKDRGLYKIAFYIWLDENELGAKYGKDENGNIGYGLKYIDACVVANVL